MPARFDRSAMKDPSPSSSRPNLTRWRLIAAGAGIVLIIAFAVLLNRSLPPSTVVIATDLEGGIYSQIARHYQEIFARHGVRLELLATNGSVENVKHLLDPRAGVSVALVQGGVTSTAEAPELVSLGTLFYEPFWLFSRVPRPDQPGRLREGLRLSLGIPGSGTYKHARELAVAVGMDLSRAQVHDLDAFQAGEALMRAEVDMIGMMLPLETPIVHQLFVDESIQVFDWLRADAHVALRPYLSKLVLPRGVADLPRDRPAKDLTLVATKTSLVVRRDLHTAIQYLLLEAASEVHGAPGVFNKAGEFPAAEPIDLPLSTSAREYYRSGQPFLYRHLPFWLAALASPLMVLIPVVGVVYPLFRLVPLLYRGIVERRIFFLYSELKFLEAELEVSPSDSTVGALSQRLDRLEERADHLRVPNAYMHMLYTLKHHISLVRHRLTSKERDWHSSG
ncbi:MAG TPA: TAXI family TRAP transporter solute-binding subunit [Nitrospiraceae bacterium]|nr:TAXI family TRAP transporter solute-binding subunit [Nitrospiraceae bacterium]